MVDSQKAPNLIAKRYRVETVLGRGGMAVVYLVHDVTTKKRVALKQLVSDEQDEARYKHISELFENEFHTLVQLSHPRVVEVYDFGKDDGSPYYTMELLEGGDLRGLAPIPWKRACALLYDVCSALSVLHSRRFVHRDLTPSNIRCSLDNKAKLIDFGAMLQMGPCKHVVGTPTFTPPEVVTLQTLDARTDLYSLGATLYYVLTGYFAYPARNFNILRDAWRSRPKPPSAFVPDIPNDLDALILSLLELDPAARPSNAAEVMDRLSAIAGLDTSEQLLVSQSYLSTPTLVGRDAQLIQVRKVLIGALRGYGNTVVIEGVSGMGRSRFLDGCVLEGKLLGATVLRADASDAHSGNWGVIRAITNQLLDVLPDESLQTAKPYLPILGHILPELLRRTEDAPPASSIRPPSGSDSAVKPETSQQTEGGEYLSSSDVRLNRHSWRPPPLIKKSKVVLENIESILELRPRVQSALRDWIFEISKRHCLVFAIDDIERIDEPSVALFALLADGMQTNKVVVIATSKSDGIGNAATSIKMLKQTGRIVTLDDLSLEHVQALLGSVFGEVPNLQMLADRLHKVSRGSPSAVMKFAQHMVDKGLIRYGSGAWTLPSKINTGDLPDSIAATFKDRSNKFSDDARMLAQALALCPEQSVSVDECYVLAGHQDKAQLVRAINELLANEVVSTDGRHYALYQQGWVSVLINALDKEHERILHLRLAQMFSQRGNQACRVARHLFKAGEEERGLDELILDAEADKEKIDQSSDAYSDFVLSLPTEWREIYEHALGVCQRLGRPKKQSFLLRVFLTRISDHSGLENKTHVMKVVEQLVHDSGLYDYQELGDSFDAQSRLWKALELTQQRFDSSPDSERVLPPQDAIPELAKTLSNVIGISASSYDFELLDSMPSLEPLVPLSPALGVMEQSVFGTKCIFSANLEKTFQVYRELLQRVAEPDHCGLNETIYKYLDLGHRYALGLAEASVGKPSSIEWADQIEQNPLHQVNAWLIRLVYYLRQADIQQAEHCKKTMEMLLIQNSPSQFYEGSHIFPELLLYAAVEDLVRIKQIQDDVSKMAERFKPWVPIRHFARGEYQRIRGDYQSALIEHEKTLSITAPGRHITWPHSAGAHIRTLCDLGRFQEGKTIGEQYLLDAHQKIGELESLVIRIPLSITQAQLGDFENAVANCQFYFDKSREQNMIGFNVGLACETRAHVAILMKDEENFRRYAELCAEVYQKSHYAALSVKYEKLLNRARQAGLTVSDDLAHAVEAFVDDQMSEIQTAVADILTNCNNDKDRLEQMLTLIVRRTKSKGGYLYAVNKDGPTLCAQTETRPAPNRLDSVVREFLETETSTHEEVTKTCADLGAPTESAVWNNVLDGNYSPVLLGHSTEAGYAITGIAVLYTEQPTCKTPPTELITVISKSLQNSDDVDAIITSI
jgi:serine/threonine protein kinase/tetratricopeptide (TPR) repeat protein